MTIGTSTKGTDPSTDQRFLFLDAELSAGDLMRNLRINALSAHQVSMGQGEELAKVLQGAIIKQMEMTHRRVQLMSILLSGAGLVLLAAAGHQIIFGRVGDIWTALIAAGGGLATFAATFWTAPLDKISDSISDLVKLETVFLGYIRVIGEIDRAFQM